MVQLYNAGVDRRHSTAFDEGRCGYLFINVQILRVPVVAMVTLVNDKNGNCRAANGACGRFRDRHISPHSVSI